MTGFFDKLGLSSQERRLVVIVGIVVFVVLNIWFIIPQFGEYGKYEGRIEYMNGQLTKYRTEIQKEPEYQRKLKVLKEQGSEIASEEAALRLQQEVVNQAILTRLGYSSIVPVNRMGTTKTNAFFDEAAVNVSISTGEKELIDFLVRLADKDLLIRAKSMDIGPDPSQMRLQGNLTLVKSFQRKPPGRASQSPSAMRTTTPTPAPPPASTPTAAVTSPKPPTPAVTSPKPSAPAVTTPPPGTQPTTNIIPQRTLPRPVKP